MNDDQRKALSEYNAATVFLQKGATTKGGGKGAEARYATAYQGLVRLGLARQIRAKYRASK